MPIFTATLYSNFFAFGVDFLFAGFLILRDEGISFALNDFHKLEGVYVPAVSKEDTPIVGINVNRPITRQRFTAAHELCHHLRDADKQIACPTGAVSPIEKYADNFAAALLMPLKELREQVDRRKNNRGNVNFDAVLEIADYFGVSFETCLYRIAYRVHAIEGDTEPGALRKRIKKYKPDNVRRSKHLSYAPLYAGLIDNYREQLSFQPSDYARYIFQNDYIYNDSRMEGLDVSLEDASEIVTDLRMHSQNSIYCTDKNEVYMSIAGHYSMYQDIFAEPVKESISVFDSFRLNKTLFSFYPHPEFGGQTRQTNTLVLGAKFETVDHNDIFKRLSDIDADIKEYFSARHDMPLSEFIMHVARTHHQITVIHPFSDGNGRTSRAFMNMEFVRSNLPPIYIKVEDKEEYREALSRADQTGEYDDLYELIFRLILKSHVALNKAVL